MEARAAAGGALPTYACWLQIRPLSTPWNLRRKRLDDVERRGGQIGGVPGVDPGFITTGDLTSDLPQAAVDAQFRPGDVARVIAQQEQGGRGHF